MPPGEKIVRTALRWGYVSMLTDNFGIISQVMVKTRQSQDIFEAKNM
jgi:hypothetical protein